MTSKQHLSWSSGSYHFSAPSHLVLSNPKAQGLCCKCINYTWRPVRYCSLWRKQIIIVRKWSTFLLSGYWFNLFTWLYTPSFLTADILIITLSFSSPINTLGGIFQRVRICIDPACLLGGQHEVPCAYSSLEKLGILNRQDCLSDGKDV